MPVPSLSDIEIPAKRELAKKLIRGLKRRWPDAECALHHRDAFELTVAVILSAQCTDERVNKVTPALFRQYPDAAALAKGQLPTIERLLNSVNYFRTKAKNIRAMARAVVSEHDGEIPADFESLTALAGIGRKTANVVLGVGFGVPSGVVVDTHVKRISNLFGLTHSDKPEVIELDLAEVLPRKEWIDYSHRVIEHGRHICIARRPQCPDCPLLSCCERVGLPKLD